jgi:hypothetical protein
MVPMTDDQIESAKDACIEWVRYGGNEETTEERVLDLQALTRVIEAHHGIGAARPKGEKG